MKWLVGVLLVLVGLTLGTTGMHLIRMSELKKKAGHDKECCFYYICGMFMNILLGPLLDVCGYAFAPAALIAPFTGINIIINSVVAPYTLGEELTPRRLFSATVVFVAATASIAFKHLEMMKFQSFWSFWGRTFFGHSHLRKPRVFPGFPINSEYEVTKLIFFTVFFSTKQSVLWKIRPQPYFYPRHSELSSNTMTRTIF